MNLVCAVDWGESSHEKLMGLLVLQLKVVNRRRRKAKFPPC